MQIFVSHSTKRSSDFGVGLYQWLQDLPLGLKPWASFSNKDLPAGPNDYGNILAAAQKSAACISILTEENINRPWISFEAGLFYGNNRPVFAMLCGGLSHQDLKSKNHPLSNINFTYVRDDSLLRMITTINENISQKKEDGVLERIIKSSATIDLKEKYNNIFDVGSGDNLDALAALVKP